MSGEEYEAILARGREVLSIEAAAILGLRERLGEDFVRVAAAILACPGKVVVTGIGKSGHVARKIAATFASLGTPAFFLHPGEGVHGDLGMVSAGDLVLALSYSGESHEVLALIPTLKILGCPLVAMVGKADSELARRSDYVLLVAVEREADPLGLAPTASSAAMLALGDALAVAVAEITAKGLGATNSVDAEGRLVGLLTDGDLRRFLARYDDALDRPVTEAMTRNPRTIGPEALAAEAMRLMERTAKGVTVLPVVVDGRPVGMIHMHDILRALTAL
ncbi:MAG: SIS domain-containing protein [Firmicutes bacterium]|nr:SIS domain-containing protein [Bacillota bacterium]